MSYSIGTSSDFILPDNANNVITWIRQELGEPVIEVNLTDEQIKQQITKALLYCMDYLGDFTDTLYVAKELEQSDIDNKYITVANNVLDVRKVFQPTTLAKNLFEDVEWNMMGHFMLSDYANYNPAYLGGFTEYMLMKEQLEHINWLFKSQKTINFKRYNRKLEYYANWEHLFKPGQFLVYEAKCIVDPELYGNILSNRYFLELSTAFTKKLWGEVLSKFTSIPLMGGLTLNGAKMIIEAQSDIDEAKQNIESAVEMPFLVIG